MDAREILQNLIAFPTLTPQECGIYAWIEEFLGDGFIYERIDRGAVKNLFAYKDFNPHSKAKKFHFCFAGHVDVVPAGEGWSGDPFTPIEIDGYLYGRGAQDMKGGIACFLHALKQFSFHGDGIVSILLTSDEEGEAIDGTRFVLEKLQERDFLPDLALVAEPTSVHKVADTFKIGRRGSINGILRIEGVGGHVAYPQKCSNPVELLAERLPKIAGVELDAGDEFFDPSKIVIADIRGGMEVCNVTPSDLKLMFNVRNSMQTDEQKLKAYLEDVLRGLPYHLDLKTSSHPFLTQSPWTDRLMQSVQKVTGYAPKPSTSGGTSDARFFALLGVDVLELGGVNDRIHAVDECVALRDLETLGEIFLDFLSMLYANQCKEKVSEGS